MVGPASLSNSRECLSQTLTPSQTLDRLGLGGNPGQLEDLVRLMLRSSISWPEFKRVCPLYVRCPMRGQVGLVPVTVGTDADELRVHESYDDGCRRLV